MSCQQICEHVYVCECVRAPLWVIGSTCAALVLCSGTCQGAACSTTAHSRRSCCAASCWPRIHMGWSAPFPHLEQCSALTRHAGSVRDFLAHSVHRISKQRLVGCWLGCCYVLSYGGELCMLLAGLVQPSECQSLVSIGSIQIQVMRLKGERHNPRGRKSVLGMPWSTLPNPMWF